MSIAYFDCFSGISGDMVLGALIDAGLSPRTLRSQLKSLPLSGYSIKVRAETRGGILGRRVIVTARKKSQRPRSYVYIKELIQNSALEEKAKGIALKIFRRLAEVEARIHGQNIERVHFHEIGATDSIVDVVGAAIGVSSLGLTEIYSSIIPVGRGFVSCEHGTFPVPSPATLSLLKGVPVHFTDIEHELVTPTGAAMITSISRGFGQFPPIRPKVIGYGAGERDIVERPNLLRIIIGEKEKDLLTEEVDVLESNIDDMNPVFHGYMMERLFECGALDVSLVPIHMKKNRPGILLKVMSRPHDREKIVDLLFKESTTLGVRCYQAGRLVLKRRLKKIRTPHGYVRVKIARVPEGEPRLVPEYEDCRRIAKKHGVPLRDIYQEVIDIARKV